ncbi:exodeoxyribonuclease VII large subunit [Haloarcula argentinensis]|uniref:Exodeoxyribonuclease VII large subunit n=1 Tax=Haloarcula argentinensis TaxID=43776 RepID=A0A847UFY0_HALAR|nr:exodeoxyribonuclease VII large subunit [Haloarcula argentinensis]NLV12189.1 exodeoxyribonuclease VII large subunit [Haloarcula argentinensis]
MGLLSNDSTVDDVEPTELPDDLDVDALIPVEDVTTEICGLFKGYPKFDNEYIIGEIGDLSTQSDHLYFSLTAARTDGKLKCVVWESKRGQLDIEMEQNMLVAAKGDLTFFEAGGYPSLEVDDLHLVGESAYWQRIQQLRRTLADEGLLADERKQSIPTLPTTIGVVTAAGSDAEQDIIESLRSQHPGVDIRLFETTVQGDSAPSEIADAVSAAETAEVDVLVISRGGGSDDALRPFNEEPVVRSVATAETPTVAAIGHDADEPLIDEVADVRVQTPTAVGSAVMLNAETYREDIAESRQHIQAAYNRRTTQWLADTDAAIQDEATEHITEWFETARDDISTAYRDHIETWLAASRTAISSDAEQLVGQWTTSTKTAVEGAAHQLMQSWLHEHRRAIRDVCSDTVPRWTRRHRRDIQSAYRDHTERWVQSNEQAIRSATRDQCDRWLRSHRRAIRSNYQQLTKRWLTDSRTAIDNETARIEREQDIQAQKQGLERRNYVLIALVLVLLLIVAVLLAVFLGFI